MRKMILVLVLAIGLTGCSSDNDARRALEGAGYTNIQTTGYSFFGCGKDDSFRTGFTAVGPTGVPASGVVCSGRFKGATIRTD